MNVAERAATPRGMRRGMACLVLALACACGTPCAGAPRELELRILHTNDTHAFLAGADSAGNACFASAACIGGMGRMPPPSGRPGRRMTMSSRWMPAISFRERCSTASANGP